ncbi:MAG: hypothetical protein J5582_04750 [Ruminococcus sp.]|jgi:hypothetical protein|uniref:Uncharacterized protein n=1 Tax=Ruminococcus albus TaxID=1264 RepID=A0A1H7I7T6_RUMAL|nr:MULTISPECIES: hypothetical protein [Ruminococcus]MBO4865861.1 hypothetical protein [Ruminococcus sp.]SEK57560.1 hypothetical protein SAMN05216469_103246 [Ruminococcus albus]SFD05179.1 hypothetical protein SAMN02910406_02975 [Ruminococcus albus]
MVIKKIKDKIKLRETVKAERMDLQADFMQDCAEQTYAGYTARTGCRRRMNYSAKLYSRL